MRKYLLGVAALALAAGFVLKAAADTYVRGYTRQDGTYVAPHYRSSPNSTPLDNWSTRGNVNPYTGQQGTRSPSYGSYDRSPSYGGYGSLGGSRGYRNSPSIFDR